MKLTLTLVVDPQGDGAPQIQILTDNGNAAHVQHFTDGNTAHVPHIGDGKSASTHYFTDGNTAHGPHINFAALASRYVEEHARKRNKSWRQADKLIRRYVLPTFGEVDATSISRTHVRQLIGGIAAPALANQVRMACSAIFRWAISQDLVTDNPCRGITGTPQLSRERVLSDEEIKLFWAALPANAVGMALRILLLTGQRPGEVARMRHQDVKNGWWTMPGKPEGEKVGSPNFFRGKASALAYWPGTKNGATHRVWLPPAVQEMLKTTKPHGSVGPVFKRRPDMRGVMRRICTELKVPRATPHDLRRTHGTMVTRLGFGRAAMNRIQNHKDGGIASVYDRYEYADENKRVMEAVAAKVLALATAAK